jgi:Flp pilus assembly protein TadG
MVMKLFDFLKRHGPRFGSDGCGNVAIMFALATIPVFGAVGAAVDYSRASSARTAMQAALDSTALMLSKEITEDTAKTELQKKADKYFFAIYNRPEGHNITVTPDLKTVGASQYSLTLEAHGKVETTVARVVGTKAIGIDATSQVAWGMKKLEVALALDNTGSMAQLNKMTELKKAVNTLLDTLKQAEKKKDDIKVAIIPFDYTVNIGTLGKDPAWISWTLLSQKAWDGCIGDRASPFDTQDTTPSALDLVTLFPAVECAQTNNHGKNVATLATIQPLTSNWVELKKKVTEMQPNGNTNIPIGLVWGWHAVTKNLPLDEAQDPKFNLEKIIILLTDGLNTANRFGEKTAQIDARTRKLCDNIRAAKIQVYTVRVIEGNATLLKDCATSPDMYYDVQNASDLNAVFQSIASKLAKLHIAK